MNGSENTVPPATTTKAHWRGPRRFSFMALSIDIGSRYYPRATSMRECGRAKLNVGRTPSCVQAQPQLETKRQSEVIGRPSPETSNAQLNFVLYRWRKSVRSANANVSSRKFADRLCLSAFCDRYFSERLKLPPPATAGGGRRRGVKPRLREGARNRSTLVRSANRPLPNLA